MNVVHFTPWSSLAGGALIGLAASVLLLGSGRIAGISGLAFGALRGPDRAWRVWFLLGLLAVGLVAQAVGPTWLGASPRSLGAVALAGLLVGVGTRLGSGCTSGHGVCGISRWSRRSLVATALFLTTGTVTATLMRALGGAS